MTDWKIQKRITAKPSKKRYQAIVDYLFSSRGLKTPAAIKEFQQPIDPLQLTLQQVGIKPASVKKSLIRVRQAIKDKQPIFIYGDYDADGVCATAIMWEALYALGAQVLPFMPHREKHGYGLKPAGIDDILSQSSIIKPLIITVDNGIVAHQAVDYAGKQGVEVIITDHHQPTEKLPKASGIVHTTQLSGAGVAWFFSRELLKKTQPRLINSLLDMMVIGTVADMMPLIGVNRSLVKFGLEQLVKTKRFGLQILLKNAGLTGQPLSTYHLNFMLAPRINATGRLGHALDSLRLMCTKDHQRALALADKLGEINRQRQDLTQTALDHALNKSSRQMTGQKLIFVADSSYHQGIIGLVAGKLSEKYSRPAIVISQDKPFSRGSARSVKKINLIKILRQFKDLFVDLGGHPMAAGFTIENKKLALFKKKILAYANRHFELKDLQPSLTIDCQIELTDISQQLYRTIDTFAPFGIGNPRPLFCSQAVKVGRIRAVGSENKHLKLQFHAPKSLLRGGRMDSSDGGTTFDAIAFNLGHLADQLQPGQLIDVAYTIDENFYNGRRSLQMKVVAVKV
ncbi:single-stranded-DNA-specific exonuclease RecJ [Patescibacteria group bacterium]|nr:single-stranded-DNA-specific exonuclease RecJ [Patescibacteria group bacterium]MBU1931178.1 single-stranded-DNA-specific exonuclease RecJ [Patescibacteria group bacterium]